MDHRIRKVFQEVFDSEQIDINEMTSNQNVPGWDSLAQVKLLVGLEEEFDVKFDTSDVAEMTSVARIKSALEQKLVRV